MSPFLHQCDTLRVLNSLEQVRIHPPEGGGSATIGSPDHSTRIMANGTDMVVEFMPGLELTGFLNDTFYPDTGKDAKHGYNPALVTLEIQGKNLTLRGENTVLRRITTYGGSPGSNVLLEGLQFIDSGWDGMYVRGIVGLTLKKCVFVSYPTDLLISIATVFTPLTPALQLGSALPQRHQHHRHSRHAGRRLHFLE